MTYNIGDPQTIKVRLKASKTDPFRKGVDIVIGRTLLEGPGDSYVSLPGYAWPKTWVLILVQRW